MNPLPLAKRLQKEIPLRLSTPLIVLLIFIAVLAAFGGSLADGFLIDDHALIRDNDLLKSPARLLELVRQPYLSWYHRPVVFLSFFFDYRVWKLAAFGYHLTNILLHFMNALLVYVLLRRLFAKTSWALLTALLFAVHPLHTIPVHYIADRGNLLMALWSFLSLLTFDKAHDQERKDTFLFASTFFLLLALLSRENAVLLPFYLLLWAFTKGWTLEKRDKVFLGLSFLSVAAFIGLKPSLQSIALGTPGFFLSAETIGAFGFVFWKYLSLTILPTNILWIREIRLTGAEVFLFPSSAALCLALWTLLARRHRHLLLGGAWFLIGLLPLFPFLRLRSQIGLVMQDNQVYFASLGLIFLLALSLLSLRKILHKRLWGMLIIICLGLYAARSYSCGLPYRNPKTFLIAWLQQCPRAPSAAVKLAEIYEEDGDDQQALALYERSLSDPSQTCPSALLNVARIHAKYGDFRLADEKLQEALRNDPSLWEVHDSLGMLAFLQDKPALAERSFRDAIALDPSAPVPRAHLISAMWAQGRSQEAIVLGEQFFSDFPTSLDISLILNKLYLETGEPQKMKDVCRRLMENGVPPTGVLLAGARLFNQAGYKDEAAAFIARARALHPAATQEILGTASP